MPTERRLAAIMFTDIVGSTAVTARSESAGLALRDRHRKLVRTQVERYHGRFIEAPGDESLSTFESAVDAVHAALAIQEELEGDAELQVRIGIHTGETMFRGEEVFGDAVNIAARIRELAEPGQILVSAEVAHAVQNQADVACTSLGDHELKNVARPVEVFAASAGARTSSVPGFASRPAIAVLAFDNLSGDREQEYFADGLAEDLITRLSACRQFPVIARNSSFVYKGSPVDVKRVSRELGVRYVVEGSVRRAANRVRISAQLIDATSGAHIWAERYDRELSDVFALQDEITEAIAGSMQPGLWRSEAERARRAEPRSLDAWELAQRGWWHFWKFTREDFVSAQQFLTSAVELDPELAWACSGLAILKAQEIMFGWADSPSESLQRAIELAQRSAELDPGDFFSQVALSTIYALTGQRTEFIAAAERALELNPSLALAHYQMGKVRAWTGHPAQAIEHLEQAMRLSPRDPLLYAFAANIGIAHFNAERYTEATEWLERGLQQKAPGPATPGDLATSALRVFLVAALAQSGRIDEARAMLQTITPGELDLGSVTSAMSVFESDYTERFIDGLRKAGWKESDSGDSDS